MNLRFWACVSGILLALCLASMPAQAQNSVENARKEVRGRLSLLLDRQDQLDRTVTACRRDISEIDEDLNHLEIQTKKLENERRGMSSRLSALKAQVDDTAARLDERRDLFQRSLRSLYLWGPEASAWLLSSAQNFHDALTRSQALTALLKSLKKRLEKLQKHQSELTAKRTQLAYRHNEILEIEASLVLHKTHLQTLKKRRGALLLDLKENQEVLAGNIQALKDAEARLARTFALSPRGRGVVANRGRLAPPVEGEVVGRTGPARRGVVLKARPGAPVRSPWWGRVVFAGPLSGYGKVAVVDHGQRVHTVLAHLGALSVEKGQKLKAGQVVGAVDAAGRLYLEVRRATRPENPLIWLHLNP